MPRRNHAAASSDDGVGKRGTRLAGLARGHLGLFVVTDLGQNIRHLGLLGRPIGDRHQIGQFGAGRAAIDHLPRESDTGGQVIGLTGDHQGRTGVD